MPLRDREFERDVQGYIESKQSSECQFRLDWIADAVSWFLSATCTVHGKRAMAYKYLLGIDPSEAIEWIDFVNANLKKPRAIPVVLLDTKPVGVRVDHHDHCWVTEGGFELIKGKAGQ